MPSDDLEPLDPRLTGTDSFTPELREAFLLAIAKGGWRDQTASALDIPWSVLERTIASDQSFRDRLETLETRRWVLAEQRLHEALDEGEPWAVREALKRAPGVRDRFAAPEQATLQDDSPAGSAERVIHLLTELENARSRATQPLTLQATHTPEGADVLTYEQDQTEETS